MGTKSPSKFISLNKLIEIRDNNYRGNHQRGGLVNDYDAPEVDALILEKQAARAERLNKQSLREFEALDKLKREALKSIVSVLKEKGILALGENDLMLVIDILAPHIGEYV